MPVYNAALFLKEAIHSVLSQTHNNLELIVINDGSTDSSEDIILSFKDCRIRYFFQENSGQAAASNFGIEKASGIFIKFFDADDIMNPAHLAMQLKSLDESDTAIASCNWGRFYDRNPESALFNEDIITQQLSPIDWLKTALQKSNDMMAAWLWLIPKRIIDQVGGWNTALTLNNDFEFSVRLLLAAEEIVYAPGAKLYYRSGESGSLSKNISEKAFEQAFLSTHLGCTHLLTADRSEEMKSICANRYQVWIHRIYPKHPALLKQFEQQVQLLGGSNLPLAGGRLLRILEVIFGWKLAKRTKYLLYRLLNRKDDLACLPT